MSKTQDPDKRQSQVIIIYGPTSTGKTNLALRLSKKYNGEIISADSRQVYKNLDIGSGKVDLERRVKKNKGYWVVDGIKIHGFDIAKPGDNFSVYDFIKYTSLKIKNITSLGKRPVIAGGTGFYISSLINGLHSAGIGPNEKLRKQLLKLSRDDLYKKLQSLDWAKAGSLNNSDKNNPRRLIRAIEISLSKQKATVSKHPVVNYNLIGLSAPNKFLFSKSDEWLETRFEKIVEEIKNLISTGVDEKWIDNLGLEYRWISRYVLGKISRDVSKTKLKRDQHAFIRRQKTWFGKFKNAEIFDVSKNGWQQELEKDNLNMI